MRSFTLFKTHLAAYQNVTLQLPKFGTTKILCYIIFPGVGALALEKGILGMKGVQIS